MSLKAKENIFPLFLSVLFQNLNTGILCTCFYGSGEGLRIRREQDLALTPSSTNLHIPG